MNKSQNSKATQISNLSNKRAGVLADRVHLKEKKCVREKNRGYHSSGGGVLQGKGPFPSSVWDPWWNREAQGASLLKKIKIQMLPAHPSFLRPICGHMSCIIAKRRRAATRGPERQLEIGIKKRGQACRSLVPAGCTPISQRSAKQRAPRIASRGNTTPWIRCNIAHSHHRLMINAPCAP